MHIFTERIFDNEKQARRFSYRVKGIVTFTQALDNSGMISPVWVVRYIPKTSRALNC